MTLGKTFTNLMVGLAAMIALAAVPAVASANTLVYKSSGEPVPTETAVRAISTNSKTATAAGELICKNVDVGGTVGTNSSGTATIGMHEKGEENPKEIAEECVRKAGGTEEALTVTFTFQHLHLETGGTNTAALSYVVHYTALGISCAFEGEVSAKVVSEGAALQAEGVIAGKSPAPCPTGGNFTGTFSLTDELGATLEFG